MKTYIVLFFAILTGVTLSAQYQTQNSTSNEQNFTNLNAMTNVGLSGTTHTASDFYKRRRGGSSGPQNVVKLGLGSAIISTDLNLKYERLFAERHGVQLSVLIDFPEQFGSTVLFPLEVPEGFETKLSGFALAPEYRYYFADKEGPRGFYAGVYARYRERNLVKAGDFGSEIDFDAKVNIRNFGGGIGCGVQWLINDAFVIDWYIFGIGYNSYGAKVVASPTEETNIEELKVDMLREIDAFDPAELGTEVAVEDLEEFKNIIRAEVEKLDADNLEVNTPRAPFGSIEFRAGLSVGYAF